jgi:predicted RNA polymerase sigma factor
MRDLEVADGGFAPAFAKATAGKPRDPPYVRRPVSWGLAHERARKRAVIDDRVRWRSS